MGRGVQLLPGFVLAACLAGCVTESIGGFSEGSETEALANYLQLSARYLEQGDLGNARRTLGSALAIDPRNSEAFGLQALLLSSQGDLELAEESFRRALSYDGSNSQVRNNYAAFLYAQERHREAADQLRLVVRDTAYRARPQAFENLGIASLRLNRPDEAESAFTRALQLNPQLPRANLELAELNLRKGELAQARRFYGGYLSLNQLYNTAPSARGLWIGIQLENALGNDRNVAEYAQALQQRFGNSEEYQLYLKSLEP